MAIRYPGTAPVVLEDPVEREINQTFNRLIDSLNLRRSYLLAMYRQKRDDIVPNQMEIKHMEDQLTTARTFLQQQITHNQLNSMQERMGEELEAKLAELRRNAQQAKEVKFSCDTRDLETHISLLGEIRLFDIPPIPPIPAIPDYMAFQQPTVAVGKVGSAPGEFDRARGVAIQENTGQIYVADLGNHRIQIFSENGYFLNQFGNQFLISPWGILVHEDKVYVTDFTHNAVFMFSLPDLKMAKRVGKGGSGPEEFNSPQQLALSPNQRLYVADENNHRLQILNRNLVFQGSLQYRSMTQPVGIQFSNNQMFVLSSEDNPCVHIFTLLGEKIRSIITSGDVMQVEMAYFFCLDARNNIIISDFLSHNLKVFSSEGDLIRTIEDENQLNQPSGIAILRNTKLVFTSSNQKNALQILSA